MYQPAVLYTEYAGAVSVTATDSLADSDPEDVLLATEDTWWAPANQSGSKSLIFDFGAGYYYNAIALLGRDLDGVTVEIRGSTDNFSASDFQIKAPTALSAPVNAGWLIAPGSTVRYHKVIFSGFSSDFRVAHVCLDQIRPLPYLSEDFDPDGFDAAGEQLVSSSGVYVGSTLQRTMRELPLDLGQVTDSEYAIIAHWAENRLRRLLPYFFLPEQWTYDTAYFGWNKDGRFSAPLKDGVRTVAPMTFVTRAL